jgi:hypothetical protein
MEWRINFNTDTALDLIACGEARNAAFPASEINDSIGVLKIQAVENGEMCVIG